MNMKKIITLSWEDTASDIGTTIVDWLTEKGYMDNAENRYDARVKKEIDLIIEVVEK